MNELTKQISELTIQQTQLVQTTRQLQTENVSLKDQLEEMHAAIQRREEQQRNQEFQAYDEILDRLKFAK